jgi:hypothetical protein
VHFLLLPRMNRVSTHLLKVGHRVGAWLVCES